MLCGVFGDLGSGKTLFLTYLAFKNQHLPVFSNFTIKLPNVKLIDADELITLNYSKALILLDEAYVWLESRLSYTDLNRYMSYIAFQSRKRGLDIVLTAQLSRTIDIRYRELFDMYVLAEKADYGFKYTFVTGRFMRVRCLSFDFAEKLFDLYDTYQIILPPDIEDLIEKVRLKARKEDLNQKIEELTEQFLSENRNIGKVTKIAVKDFLLKRNLNMQYADFIYNRVKMRRENEA